VECCPLSIQEGCRLWTTKRRSTLGAHLNCTAVILYTLSSWQSAIPLAFICYLSWLCSPLAAKFACRGSRDDVVNFLFHPAGRGGTQFLRNHTHGLRLHCAANVLEAKTRPKAPANAFKSLASHRDRLRLRDVSLFREIGSNRNVLTSWPVSHYYFLTNTGMIVLIIAMTEGKQFDQDLEGVLLLVLPLLLDGSGDRRLLSGFH